VLIILSIQFNDLFQATGTIEKKKKMQKRHADIHSRIKTYNND